MITGGGVILLHKCNFLCLLKPKSVAVYSTLSSFCICGTSSAMRSVTSAISALAASGERFAKAAVDAASSSESCFFHGFHLKRLMFYRGHRNTASVLIVLARASFKARHALVWKKNVSWRCPHRNWSAYGTPHACRVGNRMSTI